MTWWVFACVLSVFQLLHANLFQELHLQSVESFRLQVTGPGIIGKAQDSWNFDEVEDALESACLLETGGLPGALFSTKT